MKVAIYVPHGAVPDKRGFAPAIVAWNHARRLKTARPVVISAREDYAGAQESVNGVPVYRIGEGKLYRRLFARPRASIRIRCTGARRRSSIGRGRTWFTRISLNFR